MEEHRRKRKERSLIKHVKEEPSSRHERRKHRHHKSKDQKRKRPDPFTTDAADHEWSKSSGEDSREKKTEKPKEGPNFKLSGKLTEETNTYNGVVIKYNEPPEARKPKRRWRLYPFKGNTALPFIPIHRQSAYLLGRSRLIADIPIDHPSCSKQHAVLQFRMVNYKRDDDTIGRHVRPYIIDLESANGTFVNNKMIDPRCYVELLEKDVVKFGFSTREYVILHEETKGGDDYDD